MQGSENRDATNDRSRIANEVRSRKLGHDVDMFAHFPLCHTREGAESKTPKIQAENKLPPSIPIDTALGCCEQNIIPHSSYDRKRESEREDAKKGQHQRTLRVTVKLIQSIRGAPLRGA